MKKFRWLMMFILFLIFSSCTLYCNGPGNFSNSPEATVRDILPRQSFVKLQKATKIRFCNPDPGGLEPCITRQMGSSASGFVVHNDNEGSYIITAAHVCDDNEIDNLVKPGSGFEVLKKSFRLIDIEGRKFDVLTLNYIKKFDVCMIYSYGFYRPAVEISKIGASPGDVAYNLAAPIGIFDTGMIPILHGHYNGTSDGIALYSIPAAGGSSGSPIFNHKGELIGLIHSVYVRFPYISLSPTYEELIGFIYDNINKQKIVEEKIIKNLFSPMLK